MNMRELNEMVEKLFFVFLNILFATGGLTVFLIFWLSKLVSTGAFNSDPLYANDSHFLYCCLIFSFLYLYLKFSALPLIYLVHNKFFFVKKFCDRFKDEKFFRIKILFFAICVDMALLLTQAAVALKNGESFYEGFVLNFISYIIFGAGLSGTYFVLWVFLAIYKHFSKQKTDKNL